MGEVLRQRYPDVFLPGIESFPANAVALMKINRAFIEAYMLGLNHAMGSELLWREFPTDLRGSYFQQFWDVSEYLNTQPVASANPTALAEREAAYRDVRPLATWGSNTPLGGNRIGSPTDKLVLVVRAELLQRFPNTVVCAQPASEEDPAAPDTTRSVYPINRLPIGQDLVALAFDLTQEQVQGDLAAGTGGYFFVFIERPGEPQFGLDEFGPDATRWEEGDATIKTWNDLSWEYMGTLPGNNLRIDPAGKPQATEDPVGRIGNSADLAYALFQQPVMVAVHARQLF
jgi:hypothetical protein